MKQVENVRRTYKKPEIVRSGDKKLHDNKIVGKLGQPSSWQYDLFTCMCVTIGNQFEILMLIERLEMSGIHVISANTDGIVCLFDKTLEPTYYKVCEGWELVVGNDVRGKLEYSRYDKLIQTTVNDYIAVKTLDPQDPESIKKRTKTKGDFLIDFDLHKNKSNRIIKLALANYFIHNIDPKDFIPAHRKIYDFCACVRATGSNYMEQEGMINGEKVTNRLQKTVRFYTSTDGMKLLKRNADGREWQIDAGVWKQQVFNQYVEKPWEEYNINYKYYIEKTYEIINSIQPEVSLHATQMSLFAAA